MHDSTTGAPTSTAAAPRRPIRRTVTLAYQLVWPGTFVGAMVGYAIDRSVGTGGEWDGLAGLVYGGLIGLLITQLVWGAVAWRLLRDRTAARAARRLAVVAGVPVATVALAIALPFAGVFGSGQLMTMAIGSLVCPFVAVRWAESAPGTHAI